MAHAEAVSAISTPPGSRLVAGIDLLIPRERDADHHVLGMVATLRRCGATAITAATHWARVGTLRHVSLSVELTGIVPNALWRSLTETAARSGGASGVLLDARYSGEPELRCVLETTVTAHVSRTSGRVVSFPGSHALVGTLTVADVVARSAIDRVQILGGDAAPAASLLVTRDFVRPRWSGGLLLLDVQPAVAGTLVPFETPTPTPCCASHS